jgi:hypothetical protein
MSGRDLRHEPDQEFDEICQGSPHKDEHDIEDLEKESSEILTDEEVIKRRKLVLLISRYKARFPAALSTIREDLESLTIQELEQTLIDVKFLLGSQGSSKIVAHAYLTACGLFENILQTSDVNCLGATQLLTSDQNVLDTIDELVINYSDICYVKPELRLLAYTVSGFTQAYRINKIRANTPVQKEMADRLEKLKNDDVKIDKK